MAKVNCHFFFSFFRLLMLNPPINQIQPNLHLSNFGWRVPSLPLFHSSITLAKIHQFIGLLQETIEFPGNFLIKSSLCLLVELMFSELQFVEGGRPNRQLMIILVEAFYG